MNHYDYYAFQTNRTINKINEEVEFYENCEFNKVPFITDYVVYLKTRLGANRPIQNTGPITIIDKSGNRKEIKKMNMDEYNKDMVNTTFGCIWSKLKPVHKMMKINEFVEGLKYDSKKISQEKINKNKESIKEQVIAGLTEKRFLKNGSIIDYDQKKMCINTISCVIHNKKKHLYEVDWDY
jgi:hypothetical protein